MQYSRIEKFGWSGKNNSTGPAAQDAPRAVDDMASYNTTFREQPAIRWSCIDPLNWQPLPDKSVMIRGCPVSLGKRNHPRKIVGMHVFNCRSELDDSLHLSYGNSLFGRGVC